MYNSKEKSKLEEEQGFLQEACKEEERQRRSKKDSGGNGGRGVSDMSSVHGLLHAIFLFYLIILFVTTRPLLLLGSMNALTLSMNPAPRTSPS